MGNWHELIMLVLISFGTGHITLKARFGFITLSLLAVFFLLIYTHFQSDLTKLIAGVSFIAGSIYANREVHERVFDGLLDRVKGVLSFKEIFRKKPKQSASSEQSYTSNNNETQQQWKEEQARREKEAEAHREYNSQQSRAEEEKSAQQEQPKSEYKKQEYREPIEEEKPPVDTRSHLEILGLKPGFTQKELKKAYRRERARCHPDKWVGKPEHLQKAMEEEQKLVNRAYEELKA